MRKKRGAIKNPAGGLRISYKAEFNKKAVVTGGCPARITEVQFCKSRAFFTNKSTEKKDLKEPHWRAVVQQR